MDISIRSADASDAGELAKLLQRSISELCQADHCGDEDILRAWLRNKTEASVAQWLASSDSSSLVADSDGGLSGVGMLSRAGEILLLYVAPAAARQGIGGRLLDGLVDLADAWNLPSVFAQSTATAREFYRKKGFEVAGEPVRADGLWTFPMQLTRVSNRRAPDVHLSGDH